MGWQNGPRMKWNYVALVAFVLVSLCSFAQPEDTNLPAKVYPAAEARLLIGETHTISGQVAQVTAREKVTYLNLERPYPDMPFTGVIFAARTNLFGDLQSLKGKTVLITGKVAAYANTPQIVIDSTAQLRVVEEAPMTAMGDGASGKNPEQQAAPTAHQAAAPEQPAVAAAKTTTLARVGELASSMAVWCIVGSLIVITGLLTWLVIMLRRSGLGAARIPVSMALVPMPPENLQLAAGSDCAPAGTDATSRPETEALRQQAVAELAEFAKQSLVQGLYSQRKELADTQQEAQLQLAALEERLAALHLPLQQRIRAYEARIAELEKELDTRGDEVRELVQAALLLTRQRLEQAKEHSASRFN